MMEVCKNSTPHFLKCCGFKVQSICMQLCITLTRWPHLSVNLKSTFIQMCSVRWRLTLHNPSKCSIWREGLELFESSESSLACGEAGEAFESFNPGNNLFIHLAWQYFSQPDLVFLFSNTTACFWQHITVNTVFNINCSFDIRRF